MMLEALKIAFTKSKFSAARLSGSALAGSRPSRSTCSKRQSKYGFVTPPNYDQTAATSSNEPRPHSSAAAVDEFQASFTVKFLGSGAVCHHTDFGGCQRVMDSLRGSRNKKKRKQSKSTTSLIITFTSSAMVTANAGMQSRQHACELERIFVVHPHPTKERWFGLISDNTSSGSLKCFCYMTLDQSTGTDVLLSFREACRIWVRERHWTNDSEDEMERNFLSDSTIQGQCDSNNGGRLLSHGSGSTTRKVSFAPTPNETVISNDDAKERFKACIDEMHSSPFFVKTAPGPITSEHGELSLDSEGCIKFGWEFHEDVYYRKPQLPPKHYPPPSPPDLSTLYTRTPSAHVAHSDVQHDEPMLNESATLELLEPKRATTSLGQCTFTDSDMIFNDIDEDYDLIMEEILFRNFGRSFSAPSLARYCREPESFTEKSRVLYRRKDVCKQNKSPEDRSTPASLIAEDISCDNTGLTEEDDCTSLIRSKLLEDQKTSLTITFSCDLEQLLHTAMSLMLKSGQTHHVLSSSINSIKPICLREVHIPQALASAFLEHAQYKLELRTVHDRHCNLTVVQRKGSATRDVYTSL